MCSPAGDELSWLAPNLGVWFGGLQQRDEQYRTWLAIGRPTSYWLAGFFNPQGFLTAVQQEITRGHKNENWTLDTVVMHSEVTDIENVDSVRTGPKVCMNICYIYCFTNSSLGGSVCSWFIYGWCSLEYKRKYHSRECSEEIIFAIAFNACHGSVKNIKESHFD